jgi:WD domain, G-beta repeat
LGEARGGYTSLQSLFASPSSTTTFQQQNQQLLITDAEQNITFYSLLTLQEKAEQLYALFTERTVVGYNDEILDLKIIPQPEQYHDHPSPERMVVVTNSTQIRIYDTDTLSCTAVYDEHHTATILGIDVSPCGRYIVTCSKDQSIRLWSTALSITQCIAVGKGNTDAIGSIALSRKMDLYEISGKAAMNGAGAFCVSVSVDRTVKRWNLPGSTELNLTSKSAIKDIGQNQSNMNNDSIVQNIVHGDIRAYNMVLKYITPSSVTDQAAIGVSSNDVSDSNSCDGWLIDLDFGGKHDFVSYPKGYKDSLYDGERPGREGNKITIMDDWKSLIGLILRVYYFVDKEGAEPTLEQMGLFYQKREGLESYRVTEVDGNHPLLSDYEKPAKLLRDYIHLISDVYDVKPYPKFKFDLIKCGLWSARDSLKASKAATGSPPKK